MSAALPELKIDLLNGDAIPEAVRAGWRALAADSGTSNIFYEPWAAMAARSLPEADGMRLLVGSRAMGDGTTRIDAVLPLQLRTTMRGRVRVAVQNWEQRIRALGEPLIRAGSEADFWRAAIDTLDRTPGLGLYLRLSTLIADSPSTLALRGELALRGRRCDVTRQHARAMLTGGIGAADYVGAHIRKKVLKEQRRLRNRLADQGALRFDLLDATADAGPWIDDLFRLEMSGWKGREGVAAAADPAAEQGFRDMLIEAHRLGRLEFHRMRVGDHVLSLLAVITAGSTAFQLKISYDEAYAASSPGVLLEMAYLDHALVPGGPSRVDSCARAGHPMIDRIWVDRLPIVSLAIPFDRPGSRAFVAALALVRRIRARRTTPTAAPQEPNE